MSRTRLFSALRRWANAAWSAQRTPAPVDEHVDLVRAQLTRRDVLRGVAGAAAIAAMPACRGPAPSTPRRGEVRVAVVGAGVAGLHCAYRLRRYGIHAQVFDAWTRVGGRMFTTRDTFAGGQVAELGGELIDTDHACMHGIAAELGLAIDDLIAGPGVRAETVFVDGRLVDDAELIAAFVPVAAHMAQTVTAAEADAARFHAVDNTSIASWLDSVPDLSPVLRKVLEVAYVGEYGLEADEQSVLNLLYLIDYRRTDPFHILGDSDERFHIHVGNDSVPSALAAALPDQIELGTKLVAIRTTPGGGYRLSFERDAATVEHDFDHVVLALPFTALRRAQIDVELSPDKRRCIDELGYGENAKLMMQFERRVWRVDHGASGTSLTDNGVQATWATSRGQDGDAGLLTNFVGGRVGREMGEGTPADRVGVALPLIDQVFPGTAAAYNGRHARMHWPTAPHHLGSYACYRPGQWAMAGLEGERAGNLHFAGEHCSVDFQGFMEGACETGAIAAVEILDDLGMAEASADLQARVPELPARIASRQAARADR